MNNEEEDDLKEWEGEEEMPPGRLKDKWFREELSFKETVICPACGKELPRETVTCLFCGAQVFYDSGLLGKIIEALKKLFG